MNKERQQILHKTELWSGRTARREPEHLPDLAPGCRTIPSEIIRPDSLFFSSTSIGRQSVQCCNLTKCAHALVRSSEAKLKSAYSSSECCFAGRANHRV